MIGDSVIDLSKKEYIAVVQCEIVKQRCPGHLCEKAFDDRTGGFAVYPKNKKYRMLAITCGGCCGKATHRKLGLLLKTLKKRDGFTKDQVVVQLSSCITKDNYHSTPCPHIDYIKGLLAKLSLDVLEDTEIAKQSEKKREKGIYE
jgi:predicted metal-binding protein